MTLEHEIQRGDEVITLVVTYGTVFQSGEPGSLCIPRGLEVNIWSILDIRGNTVEVTPAEYDEILNRAIRHIERT